MQISYCLLALDTLPSSRYTFLAVCTNLKFASAELQSKVHCHWQLNPNVSRDVGHLHCDVPARATWGKVYSGSLHAPLPSRSIVPLAMLDVHIHIAISHPPAFNLPLKRPKHLSCTDCFLSCPALVLSSGSWPYAFQQLLLFSSPSHKWLALVSAEFLQEMRHIKAEQEAKLSGKAHWAKGGNAAFLSASLVSIGQCWEDLAMDLAPLTNDLYDIGTKTKRSGRLEVLKQPV